jgi:predicted transposase YdaD
MSELYPHDKFVRTVWAVMRAARSLAPGYLDENVVECLLLDTLELRQGAFVDEELKSHHTDLLYSCRLKDSDEEVFIYILLEHKSYPDSWIALQLLR